MAPTVCSFFFCLLPCLSYLLASKLNSAQIAVLVQLVGAVSNVNNINSFSDIGEDVMEKFVRAFGFPSFERALEVLRRQEVIPAVNSVSGMFTTTAMHYKTHSRIEFTETTFVAFMTQAVDNFFFKPQGSMYCVSASSCFNA